MKLPVPKWLTILFLAVLTTLLVEAVILIRLKSGVLPSLSPKPTETITELSQSPVKKKIIAVNRSGLADFRVADEPLLLSYLEEYRFWEKIGPTALVLGAQTVDESFLAIELLKHQNPKERYIFQYQDKDGGIQQAAGVKIENQQLHLLLYLRESLLDSEEKERLDKRINALLLRLIYSLSHEEVKDLEDPKVKEAVSGFLASGKKFVEIQK